MATVGVVGKPDELRTEIVKAYVVLKPGNCSRPTALAEEIAGFVSACGWRNIPTRAKSGFLDALPMTVTGKVIRKRAEGACAQ